MAEMIIPIPAGYVSPETRRILDEMAKAPFFAALSKMEADAASGLASGAVLRVYADGDEVVTETIPPEDFYA